MNFSISPVDVLVLAVLGFSGLYAAYRGFVNEVLTILAWGLTALVTAVLFGSVKGTVRQLVSPEWFADIVGLVGLFLAVVVPISFISYRFGEMVRQSSIGPLDRSLGFVYGVVRGLIFAGLAYMLYSYLVKPEGQPAYVRNAHLMPIVKSASDVLQSLVNGRPVKGVSVSAQPGTASPPVPQSPHYRPRPAEPQHIAVHQPAQAPAPEPVPVRPEPLVPPLAPAPERANQPKDPSPVPPSVFTQPEAPRPARAQPERPPSAPKTSSGSPKKPARPKPKAEPPKRAKPQSTAQSKAKAPAQSARDKPEGKVYGSRDRKALDQLVRSNTSEP